MRRADLLAGALLVAFGLVVLLVVIPVWVPGHAEGSYGLRAQDFPLITAGAGTVLAALLVLRSLLAGGGEGKEEAPLEGRNWAFLAGAAAGLAAAFALFAFGGFWFGAPFTIAVFMLAMGERRPVALVATAALVPLAIWLVFWKMLGFTLP